MVILSTSTEDQASDWIMKLCQTVAGSSDLLYTTLCPAARAIPCCVAVTKQHIVTFHAHINGEYRFLSSFYIQDITMILVDNEVRNYCILVSFKNSKIFPAKMYSEYFVDTFKLRKPTYVCFQHITIFHEQ